MRWIAESWIRLFLDGGFNHAGLEPVAFLWFLSRARIAACDCDPRIARELDPTARHGDRVVPYGEVLPEWPGALVLDEVSKMTERKRLVCLVLIMTGVSLIVGGIAVVELYRAAIQQTRERLVETAQSQARLIEAVARFDAVYSSDYPDGSEAATLNQIVDAHEHYKGFGKTGEFTLARKENNKIVFLLSHRHYDLANPKPVPFGSKLAEPMRKALSGDSGTVVGPDYRGTVVIAAYEPVMEMDLGIVAKIDIAEVQAPFIKAALAGLGTAIPVIILGSLLFVRITNPMIRRLQELVSTAQKELTMRKELQKQVLEIAEEESRRIGHELHDHTQQQLTGLGLLAQSVADLLKQAREKNPRFFGETEIRGVTRMAARVATGISESANHVHLLARGLVPVVVDAQGLRAALSELASRISELHEMRCDFLCNEAVELADNFVATHLYRIAQEAVNNALKHSQTERIDISLTESNGLISMKVVDNGIGIVDQLPSHPGMGLHIMAYRAGLIGATLQIGPGEDRGMLVNCTVSRGQE